MKEKCICSDCPNKNTCKRGSRAAANNLAKLINVKTLVTFVIIFVFAWLACTGQIEATQTLTIVTMVIAFYFGTQHEKKDDALEQKNPAAEITSDEENIDTEK